MEDKLLKKLKTGLEEEIKHYEIMLRVSRDEQEVLMKEGYSSELITLTSEKLRLLNQINQVALTLSPLKMMWIKERENGPGKSAENEIDPLINQLSNVLEDLLAVDRANTRKLAELTGAAADDEFSEEMHPLAASQAPKSVSGK